MLTLVEYDTRSTRRLFTNCVARALICIQLGENQIQFQLSIPAISRSIPSFQQSHTWGDFPPTPLSILRGTETERVFCTEDVLTNKHACWTHKKCSHPIVIVLLDDIMLLQSQRSELSLKRKQKLLIIWKHSRRLQWLCKCLRTLTIWERMQVLSRVGLLVVISDWELAALGQAGGQEAGCQI